MRTWLANHVTGARPVMWLHTLCKPHEKPALEPLMYLIIAGHERKLSEVKGLKNT